MDICLLQYFNVSAFICLKPFVNTVNSFKDINIDGCQVLALDSKYLYSCFGILVIPLMFFSILVID